MILQLVYISFFVCDSRFEDFTEFNHCSEIMSEFALNLLNKLIDIIEHAWSFFFDMFERMEFNALGTHRKQALLIATEIDNGLTFMEGTLGWFHMEIIELI